MRALSLLLLISLPLVASAETQQPANLEPLPPPVFDADVDASTDAPEITITRQSEQTIEEYRVSGRLYMIKITPQIGPPYYLVDDQGNGKFSRQESLDSGLRPPRWIIKSF